MRKGKKGERARVLRSLSLYDFIHVFVKKNGRSFVYLRNHEKKVVDGTFMNKRPEESRK